MERAAAYVALGDTPHARADLAEAARRKAQGSSFAASEDPFRY
ncbi:MAG TPA: hypothetical protein VFM00_01840 [Candidatus Eisenbacteria bacterium]|nr:hypothetical protein [Candidatus Eisenbacteria bacterium]